MWHWFPDAGPVPLSCPASALKPSPEILPTVTIPKTFQIFIFLPDRATV
jgi:hypothetical protein